MGIRIDAPTGLPVPTRNDFGPGRKRRGRVPGPGDVETVDAAVLRDPGLHATPADFGARVGRAIAEFFDLGLPPHRAVELAAEKLSQGALPSEDPIGGEGGARGGDGDRPRDHPGLVRAVRERGVEVLYRHQAPKYRQRSKKGRATRDTAQVWGGNKVFYVLFAERVNNFYFT